VPEDDEFAPEPVPDDVPGEGVPALFVFVRLPEFMLRLLG
jgi:hypothetical protein